MKKEEPKPEDGKEVSTFNLSVMIPGKAIALEIYNQHCIVTDLTVFDNDKTGSS